MVWVRDLVILRRGEGDKEVFYLVDSKAGAAVQGELEFFCYETDYLGKHEGKRRYKVITDHFRKKTDAEGHLELSKRANHRPCRRPHRAHDRSLHKLALIGS